MCKMGRWGRMTIGTVAATAIAMGVFGLTPTIAQAACGGNQQANQHSNQHLNQNSNQHNNLHVNEHVNEHLNAHLNEHSNEHLNAQANQHATLHLNEHVNVHVNEHANEHVNDHLNEHLNEHANVHMNVKVSQDEQSLLLALQELHCDRTNDLVAYFEKVHLTQAQASSLSTCVNQIVNVCKDQNNLKGMTLGQRQELWQLCQKAFTACGLHVSGHDDLGHPVNISDQTPGTPVIITVTDQTGKQLCTVPNSNSSSTGSHVTSIKQVQKTTGASTQSNHSDISTTSAADKLPQTATHDPLLIVIGLLLVIVGGAGLILGFRLSKRS